MHPSWRQVSALALLAGMVACGDMDEALRGRPKNDATLPERPDGAARSAPPGSVADGGVTDATPSPACPAGATLRRAATPCAGAAPASQTFADALASASPGDVVASAGTDVDAVACLPVAVCTPGDAPSLLFSDDPESPTEDGILYADTPLPGRHRIYVYHANGGLEPRRFPVVVRNGGVASATVTIRRRGLAAPSKAYVSVGKTVLLDWLAERAPTVVTVPPGERVVLDDALDALVADKDELVHAIYDVTTDAPLKFSVVSVRAGADAATVTAGLPLLARDGSHVRGTFPGADRLLVAGVGSGSGLRKLRLGKDEVDAPLEGVDHTVGTNVTLVGNYGVTYAFTHPTPHVAGLVPRGGAWGGVARTVGATASLPTKGETASTGIVALGNLDGASLVTAGGSNLPVDLLFLVR